MILDEIASTIRHVARTEDEDLRYLCGVGIFFMPERAFTYAVGKALMRRRTELGIHEDGWRPETSLCNGGPTDLVLTIPDGKDIAIEFKMRTTHHACVADIRKLRKLHECSPGKYRPVFCALLDAYRNAGRNDERIQRIEEYEGAHLRRVFLDVFDTDYSAYESDISCVVVLWEVLDKETSKA